MKRVLMALVVATMIGVSKVSAISFGDIGRDIADQTKFTLLKTGTAFHFFDFKDRSSHGGLKTSVFGYKDIITADIGWLFSDSQKKGAFVGGPSFNIGKAMSESFPAVSDTIESLIPRSVLGLYDHFSIGVSLGHNLDEQRAIVGLTSGIEFRW